METRNFKDLKVWRVGKNLTIEIYRLTALFPLEEKYGLVSQMRRAAVSIPSNIAEGFNRLHDKDYRRFLLMALSSCAELETQLEIGSELEFIADAEKNKILDMLDHESRMLRKLIKIIS
ncbi:four helix bundle protein [Methylohalomonas lacus]|uniref:Four helix bundle protein n=1 Tax=Methylohalomonas lacus TaxID=398773 RepID=A0AAE3L1Z3_9GAMM|nr:four helix bundle protein [Methylohalomonas lacus]MCS3904285.1 four helix bundle protein [Methylohalomonas lacus]